MGLEGVMFNDLMSNIEWFFNLHDKDKDGSLSKDEVLQLSESLLVREATFIFFTDRLNPAWISSSSGMNLVMLTWEPSADS